MDSQFKDQGGAATMDPSRLRRWLTSRVMSRVSSPAHLSKRRKKIEEQRQREGAAHIVEYFHEIDDGYSHLAVQSLQLLLERYEIELKCHLVNGPRGKNAPEPELLLDLSRIDAGLIAPTYQLDFPAGSSIPGDESVATAGAILAHLTDADFAQHAHRVSSAAWRRDAQALQSLAVELGSEDPETLAKKVAGGDERRRALKHYSGAMFYYGGEWYWGVDRLYHLEKRLAELGADRKSGEPPLFPRPDVESGPLKDRGSLTLEVYPSLRSPYTAISFDRAVALARETGVKLSIRPVLPMVMRGVPATRDKGMYIFTDAAREARAAGVGYGDFYDPIGQPARRAYSLYPWAEEQGRAVEFISAFLRNAFAEGVNTNKDSGLRKVVEQAGLDWGEARQHLGDNSWEQRLENNRLTMYECGLWGVPSFRLLDENGAQLLALWGQDRLWLFAVEIQRQLAQAGSADAPLSSPA